MHLDTLMVKIALIGVLGLAAQWIAWRTGRPAIVFLLLSGIVVGPVLGFLDPEADFGELQEPIIKLAVAVILFGVRTILGELVPAFQGIAVE